MMRGILSASLRKCAFIRSWSLSEDAGFLPLKLPPAWKSACTSLNLVLNLKLVLSWQPVRSGCFFFCCQMRSPGILCGWTFFLLVDGDGRGRAGGSRCFRPAFLAAEQKALPGDARPLFHKSCPKSCPGSFSGSFSGSSPSFSPKDSSLVQQNANPVKRQMTCQSSIDKFSRKV